VSQDFVRIDKNSREELRFTIVDWNGQKYIDIRVWIKADPEEGQEEIPTKKGIRFNGELLPEVIGILQGIDRTLGGSQGAVEETKART
jgi:hypothetical protein